VRATYRSILRVPGARRLVITALIARIPVGINALAVVLLVRRATGSFVDAGIVDAALALGGLLISPGQGRLIDRFGQPRILIPSALVSSAALIGLVICVHRHLPIAVLAVLAAVGGGRPPMSASMRALWAFLIPEPDRRNTAFALESVLTEVYFIAGPLLTAVIVAVASPSVAVIASVVLTVAGTTAFATSPASRRWRAAAAQRTIAGPLAGPGMRTLIVSVLPMGLAFGTLEVAMPALATRHGDPPAAGILMGAFAAGSLIGGLLYGSRTWRSPIARRYLILNALFAAGMAPLVIAGAIPVMVVLMAVAGFTLAPVSASASALLEDIAPPGTTTEAFTWIFAANMIGAAVGAAVTGILIQSSGIRTALLIPVCGVALSFLLTFARRRTLAPLGAAGGSAARADRPGGDGTPPDGTVTGGTPPQRDAGARDAGARDADAVHARVTRPRSLAAGLVVVVSLLGYRARNGRSDPRRRPRRR
jgi:MFS family permease